MAKRQNLKGPGKCLFCGGGAVPGNPMSKEHVWSDWIGDIIPRAEYRYESLFYRSDTPGNPSIARTRLASLKSFRRIFTDHTSLPFGLFFFPWLTFPLPPIWNSGASETSVLGADLLPILWPCESKRK
jgi:hypothetical protein